MNLNIKLKNIEMIKEKFEQLIPPFEELEDDLKISMSSNIKLGNFFNPNSEEKGIVIEYEFKISQVYAKDNTTVSNLDIKYIAIFNAEENELFNFISNNKLKDEDFKKIVVNANNIAYPYIKEYIESKYNKANIKTNLPLELDV